jgi:hypothetical protein
VKLSVFADAPKPLALVFLAFALQPDAQRRGTTTQRMTYRTARDLAGKEVFRQT